MIRWLVRLHRWLGIALCLLVATWFATGSVLSFVPFPSLPAAERIAAGAPIDASQLRVDPVSAALAAGGDAVLRLRLVSPDGSARYVADLADGTPVAIDAVTGRRLAMQDAAVARRVATTFTGSSVQYIDGPLLLDQWTVHDGYRAASPYYRIALDDAAGTEVYVSARTAEVAQRTVRRERAWNYAGAVVHWINLVALRQNHELWRRVVWVLAAGGIVLALAGLALGWQRFATWRRMGRGGMSPFRGWQRRHHLLGLFAGLLMLSWVGSGWLSLDDGRFFSSDRPDAATLATYHGLGVVEAARAFPLAKLQSLTNFRELEITAVGGRAVLILRGASPAENQLFQVGPGGELRSATNLETKLLSNAVATGWAPAHIRSSARIGYDDAYNLRINPLPPDAIRFILDDADSTWVQVDAASGEIIAVLDRSRRVHRWLVDGLHNFDFPWLNRAAPLWHILLLVGTTSGFLLAASGVVLGFRRLRGRRS
ncbi:MAG: PepSY domain-containing protein [Steroidobacteraceae bacterium]